MSPAMEWIVFAVAAVLIGLPFLAMTLLGLWGLLRVIGELFGHEKVWPPE